MQSQSPQFKKIWGHNHKIIKTQMLCVKKKMMTHALLQMENRRSLKKGKKEKRQKLKIQLPLMRKVWASMRKLKHYKHLQFQNLRIRPKWARINLNRLHPNQKTLTTRVRRSIAPDQAGTLQPREISVEISLWNRDEERTDENGTSGDGGKDWRIETQSERQRNGGQDQKIHICMEADKQRRLHKHQILSEIQRFNQLIENKKEQNDNLIKMNEKRERSLPRCVKGSNGRLNGNSYIRTTSEMVQSNIPDNETEWNMEKESGCEQVEQRNRETTFQNA
ncbi:MAG: hypothetical protein EZS28_000898 [Streblomastix strix]|uniref:Uncharacterized protein n=1 Tax=Streblomastix strix TaxID=222440 RepID=A0A5J4X9J1_9EUKA|nr:MAG: hypothetical protein EZS28_000898 [Streblomastix strix]